jgi:hypothetical protein
VADPHHDAARDHEQRADEAELLRAEQRRVGLADMSRLLTVELIASRNDRFST